MVPASFDQSNAYLDAPAGTDFAALSVCKTKDVEGRPVLVSCWKPTREELAEINRTGRVWLIVMGEKAPPVQVVGVCPLRNASPGRRPLEENEQ